MRKGVLICVFVALGNAGAHGQAVGAQSWDRTDNGQFTIGAEALGWRLQDSPLPFPVVTDGVIGQLGTQVLLGNQDFDTGTNRGLRISADYALGDRSGIEANIFRLASRSSSAGIESSGEPGSTDIFLPYIDATTLLESGTELSGASVYRGSVHERLSNNFQGAELNARWSMSPAGPWHLDLRGGVRYLRLHEAYTLTTESPYLPAFGPDIWQTTDRFETSNSFYGVQGGVRASFERGSLFADATTKIGLGAMRQSVGISGSLVTDDFTFGPAQTFPGGYFALPTNMGQHARTAFSVVPEVALNLGYRLTSSITMHAGYSFLYASSVVRPGNQVSRIINTSQSAAYTEDPAAALQGVAAPGFSFKSSSFRVQGINVGVTLRF
ncbi:MAG: BBP7 family outer membrane beta-barrel protein [Dokdonella sp.]